MSSIYATLANSGDIIVATLILVTLLTCLVISFILAKFFNLWLQSKMADAEIHFIELIVMQSRKANVKLIVQSYIRVRKAGLGVSVRQIEAHELAGGDLDHVTKALIAAKQSGVELSWDEACAINLSGRDIFDTLKEIEDNKA